MACFDTAFHSTMPWVARLLPIPRRYGAKGAERNGFHGLSFAYLMEELGHLDRVAAKGRVILAHLGNGAGLAAVLHGESVDTSVGFTPASELVRSTRAQAKKWVGSFATVLGGLDTLVFSGGIGENAPIIQPRVCDGLQFPGIDLEQRRNAVDADVTSAKAGRVCVRVICTDEERMIARTAFLVLALG